MAGTVGIAFYLFILPIEARPTPLTLLQVFLLTIGKALVMVSAAVIVSSQTTSVRAANLLASFIIVPVSLLLQQESLILLQSGNQVLWYILLFLLVANVILVRMGIRLFNREELLGREIDELNLRNIWRMFRRHFEWERWFFGRPPERLPRLLRWLSTWTGYICGIFPGSGPFSPGAGPGPDLSGGRSVGGLGGRRPLSASSRIHPAGSGDRRDLPAGLCDLLAARFYGLGNSAK